MLKVILASLVLALGACGEDEKKRQKEIPPCEECACEVCECDLEGVCECAKCECKHEDAGHHPKDEVRDERGEGAGDSCGGGSC